MAAGGDNSKALTQELKRLEAARQEEKDLREACEQELARVRNEAEDLALSKADLEGRLDASRAEARQMKGRAEDLERRADEATRADDAAPASVEELKGRLEASEVERTRLVAVAEKALAEGEEMRAEVIRMRQQGCSDQELALKLSSCESELLAVRAALEEERATGKAGVENLEAMTLDRDDKAAEIVRLQESVADRKREGMMDTAKEGSGEEKEGARTHEEAMDIDSELKHEQAQAQELKQRLEESKQESALLRRQREELQASVTSLQEQLEADKARIEFMKERETYERELARVRNEPGDLALSRTLVSIFQASPVALRTSLPMPTPSFEMPAIELPVAPTVPTFDMPEVPAVFGFAEDAKAGNEARANADHVAEEIANAEEPQRVLEEQISSLTNELNQSTAALQRTEAELENLRGEMMVMLKLEEHRLGASTAAGVGSAGDNEEQLNQIIKHMQTEMQELRTKVAEYESCDLKKTENDEILRLRGIITDLKAKKNRQQQDTNRLKQAVEEAQEGMKTARARADALKAEADRLREEVQRFENADVDQALMTLLGDYEELIADLKERLQQEQSSAAELKRKLEEAENTIKIMVRDVPQTDKLLDESSDSDSVPPDVVLTSRREAPPDSYSSSVDQRHSSSNALLAARRRAREVIALQSSPSVSERRT